MQSEPVKGSRMGFEAFLCALHQIAELLGVPEPDVRCAVAASRGPLVNAVTLPRFVRLHDAASPGAIPLQLRPWRLPQPPASTNSELTVRSRHAIAAVCRCVLRRCVVACTPRTGAWLGSVKMSHASRLESVSPILCSGHMSYERCIPVYLHVLVNGR